MPSSHGAEPAAKRARNVQPAAATSGFESAEQPATSVPSEPAAKRARNVKHAAASSGSGSAEQPGIDPDEACMTCGCRARWEGLTEECCARQTGNRCLFPSEQSSDGRASLEPAAKRARNVKHAAASSGSGSDGRARNVQHATGTSGSSSAEQPATSVPSAQSIAFITCAASSSWLALARLQLTIQKALEAGATIVNIAFATSIARDLVDPDAILPKLRSVFDATWTGSVGQPAYVVRNIGSVMSFFSCSGATLLSETILDPEGCLPALMLTFSAPKGRLCMIISSLPDLPMRVTARILNSYVDAAADTQAQNILIGGRWQGSPLCMENLVAKQKFFTNEFFTKKRLCLLARSPDCAPVRCFPLDTDGPYSFMGVWKQAGRPAAASSSAEQPAEHPWDHDLQAGGRFSDLAPVLASDGQVLGSRMPATHFSSVEPPAWCNLPPEVWTRVAELVGSHQPLITRWLTVTIHWTPTHHHRFCGQSCPCCRAELAKIIGSCEACNDLWQMKCVCTKFKILLQAYGMQC